MSTFIRFQETFKADREDIEWAKVNAEVVKLITYDEILDLKGKLVFLLRPRDCKRLNIPWTPAEEYEHKGKAYYIFGRDKYVSRTNIKGLSEWVKDNILLQKGLDADVIGFGKPGGNAKNNTSYGTAKTLLMDMERKNVNRSVRKTNG